jgi:hypothetical protein
MIWLFIVRNWRWFAFAVALLAAIAVAYGLVQHGRNLERAELLERSVKVLRERNTIDDETRGLSNADLCRRLRGVPDETSGKCL